jgi:hypothetical protein
MEISNFDGLVVSMLASGTQDWGSILAEAIGFFGRKNPQHAFLLGGRKAVCPMSQSCGMSKNPVSYVEVGITGQIDQPFLACNFILHEEGSLMSHDVEHLWR